MRDLHAGYGSAEIVRGVSLDVRSGEIVAVLGKNGMGKTTLVKSLVGLLKARGSIELDGEEVLGRPTHELIRRGIAYGPQDNALFGELTVEENLRLGEGSRTGANEGRWVLEHFPVLGQRLRQAAGSLSGGEQKMLILGRALIARPRLLILDEITAGLQPSMVATAQAVLQTESRERRPTILLVEQHVGFALEVADRVIVLKRGEVVLQAATDEPTAHDRVLRELSF